MGNILIWLGRGLYLGGGAIIGLMFEKISTWVAGMLPSNVKVTGSDGKLSVWFITAVSVAAGIVLYLITKFLTGKKKIFTLLLLAAGAFALDALAFDVPFEVVAASLLFTIAADTTDSVTIPYCPQFIMFNVSTVPSAFKITVVGDGVVYALDGTGLTNLNGIGAKGALPANQYVYQVADGFIGKNTTFTITNAAAAATLSVYGFSNSKGKQYLTYNMATAMANASLDIGQFDYAAFPSAAATDSFTVTWADGTSDDLTRIELESYLMYFQEVTATRYNVDNFSRAVRRIQFRGAAEQNVYYLRRQTTKGVVNQSL